VGKIQSWRPPPRHLHRARQGDAAAFEALIRGHDKHLYRVARSVLLDDQEAEEGMRRERGRKTPSCRDRTARGPDLPRDPHG
jgi:hypothetical protein